MPEEGVGEETYGWYLFGLKCTQNKRKRFLREPRVTKPAEASAIIRSHMTLFLYFTHGYPWFNENSLPSEQFNNNMVLERLL